MKWRSDTIVKRRGGRGNLGERDWFAMGLCRVVRNLVTSVANPT